MFPDFYGHQYNPVILPNHNNSIIYYDAGLGSIPKPEPESSTVSYLARQIYHCGLEYPVGVVTKDSTYAVLGQDDFSELEPADTLGWLP
jgi:hypothetical protein